MPLAKRLSRQSCGTSRGYILVVTHRHACSRLRALHFFSCSAAMPPPGRSRHLQITMLYSIVHRIRVPSRTRDHGHIKCIAAHTVMPSHLHPSAGRISCHVCGMRARACPVCLEHFPFCGMRPAPPDTQRHSALWSARTDQKPDRYTNRWHPLLTAAAQAHFTSQRQVSQVLGRERLARLHVGNLAQLLGRPPSAAWALYLYL